MAKYETTIQTTAPAEAAFDYLAKFSSAQQWDPGVSEARMTSAEPVGQGSTFELSVSFFGRSVPMTYKIVEFEAGQRVVLEATKPLHSRDTITVTPSANGSEVTYQALLILSGPSRVADPLLNLAFKRIGDKAASGLREHLSQLAAS